MPSPRNQRSGTCGRGTKSIVGTASRVKRTRHHEQRREVLQPERRGREVHAPADGDDEREQAVAERHPTIVVATAGRAAGFPARRTVRPPARPDDGLRDAEPAPGRARGRGGRVVAASWSTTRA